MPDFSSVEIPKPLDWQAFQRGCVPLFRKLVDDPTLAAFGRSGQRQNGIDLLGCRSGDTERPVGVQCRRLERALKFKDIEKEVYAARAFKPSLTELIFATTAKHDANLQSQAMVLMTKLKKGGWNCRISIFGWEALQEEIARCPEALEMFMPAVKAAPAPDVTALLVEELRAGFDRFAGISVVKRSTFSAPPIDSKMPEEALVERRDVHERISVSRDLLIDGKTETAIAQLEVLKASVRDLEPYAKYRIETNIGAAHLRAGRPVEALAQMRLASAIRPTDPKARANVALGILATGDASGALALAKEILAENPSQLGALVVLVQTIGPDVDPYQVIPPDALQDADVVASLVAVLRNRSDKRWQDAVQQGFIKHPADLRFRQWAAEAKLESIVSDDGILLGKQRPNDALDVVNRAADALLEVWRKLSTQEAVDKEPLAVLANNCAVALRFCQRLDEAASVIDATLKLVGPFAALIRMRALLHLHADQGELALKLLDAQPFEPELALLRAEILARTDPRSAATAIDEIAVADLPNSMARVATKLRLELALDLGERNVTSALVKQLEELGDSPAEIKLARAKVENMSPMSMPPKGIDENDDDESPEGIDPRPNIAELASILKAEDLDFSTRVDGAHFLEAIGANDAASEVLHGRIDLLSDSVALRIYLRASVAAGLLVRARNALLALPRDVASVPFFRRLNAALLWNSGDARKAAEIVRDLSRLNPRRLDFRLWDIDCLLRLGQKDDVRKLVAKGDLEDLEGSLKEKLRLARALAVFGQEQRALRLAYRLFQTNKDRPEVWMALMSVVLGLPDKDELNLARDVADEDSIVEVKTDRGELLRYAIEVDKQLRDVTTDAIDEAHPVAKAVRGHKPGAKFLLPDGRSAELISVKNKYLGAFHSAMGRYNDRFPSAEGLRRIAVEFETPDGLDEMKSILAERVNHVRDQAKVYADGRGFLGGLAFATGVDPIEAMLGLREVGVPFRVATGAHEEREAAFQVIQRNEKSGCIVDGPTFHLIRRLKLEKIVVAVCGPMSFAQTMLDRLRERLQLLDRGRLKPAGTLSYVDGQLRMAEFTPEITEKNSAILQSDIEWIESNGEIVAALPSSDPPAIVRRMGRLVHAKLFDDIFAASGSKRLFVAEDLMTRKIAEQMGVPGTWLQPILMIARKTGLLDPAEYARVLSDLSDFGEDFLAVDGDTLLAACHLDRDSREVAPGTRVRSVMRSLGGAKADAPSHANVVAAFLVALWDDETLASARNAISSAVLLQLVRERAQDYRDILAHIVRKVASRRDVVEYLNGWVIGHFLFSAEA